MRGLLPSVWLLGAALYTALILFLSQPVSEEWPAPPPANETVRAKQPLKATQLAPEGEALRQQAAAAPAIEPQIERRNEWVQVTAYTTVGRSQPFTASPVLFAYSVGRPLRVIAREAGFVRVQDLGSGQLGWVKETSLAPFVGGYRQRLDEVAEPQVAAAEPQAVVAKPHDSTVVNPAVAAKKAHQPRNDDAIAAQPREETVAAIEGWDRSLFKRRRDRPQPIALRSQDTSLATIVQQAFRGF
jgi:hypothetical protein